MVELMDCLLDALAIQRLSRAFMVSEVLTKLNLDYNEFGDEGCKNSCKGLENNRTLLSLSMCYCDLGVSSGSTLGHILTTTAVRYGFVFFFVRTLFVYCICFENLAEIPLYGQIV